MNPFRIADLWVELMAGLGYHRFGAQGGDWGSSVASCLGFAHADIVVGIHLNYIPGSYAPEMGPGARELSAAERAFQQERERWLQTEGGYMNNDVTMRVARPTDQLDDVVRFYSQGLGLTVLASF